MMTTIVLCGSTRFRDQFREANYELSKRGYVVLTLSDPSNDGSFTADDKITFDLVYFEKISMADAVLVIDGVPTFDSDSSHDPYVGFSTAREILWAAMHQKPLFSLLSSSGWGNIDESIAQRYNEDFTSPHSWIIPHARQVLRTHGGQDVLAKQVDDSKLGILHSGLSVLICDERFGGKEGLYAAKVLEMAGLDPVEELHPLLHDEVISARSDRAMAMTEIAADAADGEDDGNLVKFARHELQLLRIKANILPGDRLGNEMQDMMEKHIIRMVREFSREGHSGSSAPYAIGLLEKLLMFKPLLPLTGEDNEWNEVGDGKFQNRRCSHVFKNSKDGQAYDSEGRIFREPGGACFTSNESRVYITFPYTPEREVVDVELERDTEGNVVPIKSTHADTFTVPRGPLINAVTELDEIVAALGEKGNREYARNTAAKIHGILKEMTGGEG